MGDDLKMKRAERLVAMTQILMAKPNQLLSLSSLAECFGAGKSTISEDLLTVREGFAISKRGYIETLSGAAGGVRYIPEISFEEADKFLSGLAGRLSDKERILAGGYLYMTDLLFDPAVVHPLGLMFARVFRSERPDAVVTIETKGIPLALECAGALGVPMVIVRHGNKVTEGSSVNINFVSGSSQRIQTMSLSRRALEPGKRVLIIDDFIKAGGTTKGMMDLMGEFGANVVGIGMLMESALGDGPKLVRDYRVLLRLTELELSGRVTVVPVTY
ncbi:Phosphoribosyl transferase domain protein [Acididesulfobacillus acetoxydans]|uniref:Phosphoribosyl transferase domain protein n=2 Tax=Acididesulfobacillus acetoxydans TaxID=1561005 RepID=A0A8S0W6J1_9FIRM|nr:Phosphoribosyl transferase domain protein [Acididesulfobacillus acetoxydans]CEJ08967.1 Pur operon repressor [Acididesulfobacillus acetoxydans]